MVVSSFNTFPECINFMLLAGRSALLDSYYYEYGEMLSLDIRGGIAGSETDYLARYSDLFMFTKRLLLKLTIMPFISRTE